MDRDKLVAALDGAGIAGELCRDALLAGADLHVLPGLVPTRELRTIYRRRAEHLRSHGIEAIDADQAADELDRTPHADLVVGRVESEPGGHFFQLFLDPTRERVVACLAVPADDSSAGGTAQS